MKDKQDNKRKSIFIEELEKLASRDYIGNHTYLHVIRAHEQYHKELKQDKVHTKETKGVKKKQKRPETKEKKERKTLSPQEVRERNITWLLVLGVVMLLIGGLVLATSAWDTLTDWKKTGLIGLVAILFYGLAYVTSQILKIRKTAFAFYVLGSLFLPIVILSAGYFQLFGEYFSFSGEGRYLYGAAGSLVILPVYILFTVKLESRLFVWFSFISLTVLAGFLIASLDLSVDGFYLGIMAFNAVLIIGYHYAGKQKNLKLFNGEFASYIQANLILSTLMMLVFFNNELIYSFNLILTAVLYFSMIFVTERKGYHIVFSIMLVYGAYQLVEFSALNQVGAVIYALIGFVFIGIPHVIKDSQSLTKAFQYTSAVVSFFAFLYISVEGMLLRANNPSFVLVIAYIIISLNFAYLANKEKRTLFIYLSPIFMMTAFYEAVLLTREWFHYDAINLSVFIAGLVLYIAFGCLIRNRFYQLLKTSSRDVAGIVMVATIAFSIGFVDWWKVGLMFLLMAITALFMEKYETRNVFRQYKPASWIHGISIGLAVITFLMEKTGVGAFYHQYLPEPENWILAGIIVLLVSYLWKKYKWETFYSNGFFAANGFYLIGMWMTFTVDFDAVARSLVILGGVGMAYLVYRKTNWKAVPYVISGISLLFYFTVLYALEIRFDIQSDLFQSLQSVMGSLLLLGVGAVIGKLDRRIMKSFLWTGHVYLPFALAVTLLFSGEEALWGFALAVVLYGLSVRKAESGWLVNTFLYMGITAFWAATCLAMFVLDLDDYVHYSFLLTSAILTAAWYLSKDRWQRRIAFYAVPFSVIGLSVFTSTDSYDLVMLLVTVLYAVTVLIIMHGERWEIFTVFPLLLVFYGLIRFGEEQVELEYFMQFAVTGYSVILFIGGMKLYPYIYFNAKKKGIFPVIDWYSLTAILATCSLYLLTAEALWTRLLPGVMLSIIFFLQRKRVPFVKSRWIVFLAGAYLLQPYYTILENNQLPALFSREMYVLPWVILVIFLKKVAGSSRIRLVSNIQWAVLVLVSLLLIQDGMESSTIQDALIVGTLSLASILGGVAFRIKSFFFVGVGVLLLNVFLQTRPYWGNMPWWVYLLVAGSILIAVASYNEWHKQKTADGKDTMFSLFQKKVIQKIRKWQ